MGRLIDADEIKKAFDPETWQGEMMIAIADTIPTAYDIATVVRELEHLKSFVSTDYAISKAIQIVRKGGVK